MSTSVLEDHAGFLSNIRERHSKRRKLLHPSDKASASTTSRPVVDPYAGLQNYVKEEESLRNDYMIRYIETGEWDGNWVKGISEEEECSEYPKLRRLHDLKKQLCNTHTHPPLHLPFDASTTSPRSLTDLLHPYLFDVILLNPPPDYSWPEINAIPIRNLTADPSFVFLWIGKTDHDGLEKGREALTKWGFRRCEEIIWVKQNKRKMAEREALGSAAGDGELEESLLRYGDDTPKNLLVNQKEHCLMGIRGTVRRKTDNFFVHCNVGALWIAKSACGLMCGAYDQTS